MKLALVQRAYRSIAIKVADNFDELLSLEFEYPPTIAIPHIHKVSDEACLDRTGAKLVEEINRQHKRRQFKLMRLP